MNCPTCGYAMKKYLRRSARKITAMSIAYPIRYGIADRVMWITPYYKCWKCGEEWWQGDEQSV